MLKLFFVLLIYSGFSFATFCDSSPKPPIYYKTLDTIGDSITWAHYGEKFRCKMMDQGLHFDFVGYFIDPYGYHHDGHGSDTSLTVIERMNNIPISDYYFLLIGSNDHLEAQQTVDNIIKITHLLKLKNNNAIIYISTLIPKTDSFQPLNLQINNLLKNTYFCDQCSVIDVGGYFESLPNWQNLLYDGIHPNEDGYNYMVEYIVPIINI